MMNWIELVMLVAVGLTALWAFRRTTSLEKEIDYVRRRANDQIDELAEDVERLRGEVRRLRVAVRTGGSLRFTPDLRVDELADVHPDAPAVLASFHIGGCQSCAVAGDTTLAAAVQEKGANLDQVLAALNALLEPDNAARAERATIGHGGLIQIQTGR
jgi:outer membrane murein-binding lipoprotein Lpp